MENKYLIIALFVGLYLIVLFVSFYYLMTLNSEVESVNYIKRSSNGFVVNIWIHEKDFDRLKDNGIKYLFVDVGDTGMDGRLFDSTNEIGNFLDEIKKYEEENNYDFILLPYSEVNTYDYNFNRDFQDNLIEDYVGLVERGFDGIYVDVEPIRDKEDYIEFLDRVRNEFSFVGVYSGSVGNNLENEWEWNLDFYKEVCNRVDLIFVPGYDTDLKNKEEYVDYIKMEVRELSNLELNCDLMLGVPTHKSDVENLNNALEGYSIEGNRFIGVGVFAEWTTSNSEWGVFERFII